MAETRFDSTQTDSSKVTTGTAGTSVGITPGAGYQKTDAWFELPALEREVLSFWKETDAFEKLRAKNRGSEKRFSFLDGPITANNPMGVHHAWGRTLKDVYQRYHAMNGADQRWQNGFDCQGLWVEVEVEKEYGLTSKKAIREFGVENFVNICKARVRKFARKQTDQSIRLGMWMNWGDWDKEDWLDPRRATTAEATPPASYFTMWEENNYTIWRFLKTCHERGKIYRGTDVMPWSGRAGSAYSQMEVIEGRKLVAHTALFVKLPLRDGAFRGENLLIWTTTPWTLTANVAASVNTDLDYVRAKLKKTGEVLIFASENLNYARLDSQFKEKKEWIDGVPKLKTIAQLLNERGGYEVLGTVKGADLVGAAYDGPFDELEAQQAAGGYPVVDAAITVSSRDAHRVIDGGRDSEGKPVVVAGEGTGIVHTAPGCGDIDHVIGKREGLPMVAPLDEAACFLAPFGPFAGMKATDKETVELVIQSLKDKGLLLATEQYPHVYPHCWRTGDELVFRLVDEWYIDMDWRDEIKATVEQINWNPAWGKDREIEWLTNMRDWMISKKRFWGLALPIWVSDDGNEFDVIGSLEELKARASESDPAAWAEFEAGLNDGRYSPHRPWIDRLTVKSKKTGATLRRVEDVGNPWLDAGIVAYSTVREKPGDAFDQAYWQKWVPADLILECFPGQFRNWFYALLAMSTMMEHGKGEKRPPFKNLVGYSLVRAEDGREMHKSWGNAIWFDEAADKAGADAMRWLYCRQDTLQNLNFGYTVLREVRGRFINTLWNTAAFYINYARVSGFVPQREAMSAARYAALPDFDRWVLSELQATVTACRAALEAYDARAAALALEAFIEDLSNWYVRHNRRRFWATDSEDTAEVGAGNSATLSDDSRMAFETLFTCLETVTRLAAPLIPFVTERMYQGLVRAVDATAPVSVHLTEYPAARAELADDELSAAMRDVIRVTSLGLAARESKKLKVRQPLSRLEVAPRDAREAAAVRRFETMLKEQLNVREMVVHEPGLKVPYAMMVKPNLKTLGRRAGDRMKALTAVIGEEGGTLWSRFGDAAKVVVQVEGESFELAREDLLVTVAVPDDRAFAEEKGTWVAFDAVLTDELRVEGVMRDLVRQIQVLRKESGLAIEDRIHLSWLSDEALVRAAFATHRDYIAGEALALSIDEASALPLGKALDLDGVKVVIALTKA